MNRILYLGSDDYMDWLEDNMTNPTIEELQSGGYFDKMDIFTIDEFCEAFNNDRISDLGYVIPISEEEAFKLFSE